MDSRFNKARLAKKRPPAGVRCAVPAEVPVPAPAPVVAQMEDVPVAMFMAPDVFVEEPVEVLEAPAEEPAEDDFQPLPESASKKYNKGGGKK